jgi:N-acyl-D-amino-acid deacylase
MHDFDLPEGGLDWNDLAQYAQRLEHLGLGINLAPLVSHGALRIAVMGAEDRDPSPAELIQMERLLAEALQQGAWGMSTGLIYPPGSFAKTEELIALAKVLARYNALYTSHIRGESGTLMQALDEAIRIGRESGARVEVSHLKAMGRDNWGRGQEVLRRLELARRAGVDIAADQYPYEASSTSLSALVPQWAHAGGVPDLLQRLSSSQLRPRLREGIIKEMTVRGGPERILVTNIFSDRNPSLSGKTLTQIAESWGCPAEEAVIRLLLEEEAAVGAIFFSMSEEDVTAILASDQVSVGSDGRGQNAREDSGEATHPRSYGTFARILGHYVREKSLLPLATAVRKMTGLSARRLGFADRGLLQPGFAADLVLFDPAAIADRADFIHSHEYARGILHVWVNGRPLIQDGKFIGERPGRVLRKKNP